MQSLVSSTSKKSTKHHPYHHHHAHHHPYNNQNISPSNALTFVPLGSLYPAISKRSSRTAYHRTLTKNGFPGQQPSSTSTSSSSSSSLPAAAAIQPHSSMPSLWATGTTSASTSTSSGLNPNASVFVPRRNGKPWISRSMEPKSTADATRFSPLVMLHNSDAATIATSSDDYDEIEAARRSNATSPIESLAPPTLISTAELKDTSPAMTRRASISTPPPTSSSRPRAGSIRCRPRDRLDKAKTEMCRHVTEGMACPFGTECMFAHDARELKCIERAGNYRTKPCRSYCNDGVCYFHERCAFEHPHVDLDSLHRRIVSTTLSWMSNPTLSSLMPELLAVPSEAPSARSRLPRWTGKPMTDRVQPSKDNWHNLNTALTVASVLNHSLELDMQNSEL